MGVYIWNRLPSEYQEVEYIQSSGTQYINTGYVPGSNTEVEMRFKLMNRNTSVGIYLYGCRNGASGADRRSFNLELYNNKLAAHAYSNTGSYERIAYTINDISLDTLYTLKQNDYGLYLDGTLQGTFASHNSYTVQGYNMALFCGNVAGTWGSFTSLKVYSMTIKDSGTLVRNFIPCYRKSDSVIGLYDLVNNQFYTNSGTGTFSKGSDVNNYYEKLMKNAYIGEVLTKSIDVRGKTLAQIQAEGWNIYNWRGSYTLDSNGLSVSTNNASLTLYYATPTLTTSNTIEIKYSGYCTSAENTSNYGGVCGAGLFGQLSSTYYMYGLYGTYNSGYNPNGGYTGMVYNGSQIGNQGGRNKGGNISYTIKINLGTGVVDYHITSPVSDFTTTYTLNSTQITDVLSKGYIGAVIEEFTNGYIMRLHTAEFTIY